MNSTTNTPENYHIEVTQNPIKPNPEQTERSISQEAKKTAIYVVQLYNQQPVSQNDINKNKLVPVPLTYFSLNKSNPNLCAFALPNGLTIVNAPVKKITPKPKRNTPKSNRTTPYENSKTTVRAQNKDKYGSKLDFKVHKSTPAQHEYLFKSNFASEANEETLKIYKINKFSTLISNPTPKKSLTLVPLPEETVQSAEIPLESETQGGNVMQNYELESLTTGGDYFQREWTPLNITDYFLDEYDNYLSSTNTSNLMYHVENNQG